MMVMQEEWFWSWRDGVGVWASGRYLYLDMRDENEGFLRSMLIPRRTRIHLAPDGLVRRYISKNTDKISLPYYNETFKRRVISKR